MHLDLDATDRKVVLFGTGAGSRRVIARYAVAGARVTAVLTGPGRVGTSGPSVRVTTTPLPEDRPGLLRVIGPAWLVVLVDPEDRLAARVRTLCDQLKIMIVTESAADPTGSVTLVGGGPGSTGLLTVDAVDALRDADVVFYDRLAPVDRLATLAPTAELVDVGKSPYHHKISQAGIERQVVERALAGESVVRLKGGDPFVFGRGGEEVVACARAGVPVRVVPGVSSAVAVPAAAGIPVTHRGVSRSYTVISGHVPATDDELAALAALGGTVVILMGMATLEQTVAGLVRVGMPPTTPAAVIERGFSLSERRVVGTLDTVTGLVRRHAIGSPAIVVIGAVVALGGVDAGDAELADLQLVSDRPDGWT